MTGGRLTSGRAAVLHASSMRFWAAAAAAARSAVVVPADVHGMALAAGGSVAVHCELRWPTPVREDRSLPRSSAAYLRATVRSSHCVSE